MLTREQKRQTEEHYAQVFIKCNGMDKVKCHRWMPTTYCFNVGNEFRMVHISTQQVKPCKNGLESTALYDLTHFVITSCRGVKERSLNMLLY